MSEIATPLLATYRGDFLREVEANVEGGEWVKMCMQCGVCAGSCPFGPHWEHSPQKLFMMIRAGARDAVLATDSMWMCTSCYNCVVRCPRKLPITTIMHGLATYAHRLGIAPKLGLYFKDGLVAGIRKGWQMRWMGLGLLLAKRLNAFELLRGHRCKDRKGIEAMLAKAREIESRRRVIPSGARNRLVASEQQIPRRSRSSE